ncbi:hypothetical protein M0E82_04060 [Corynebacterium sp. P7202]|uniref:Cell surface protein n=1 Tax=Corynebacterium pygosceleis TaxID=2800406 RepID=A0A9Q4CA16_9CORY|nr:hypothetical protein [Corynebacterium pygosceleis]MCK7637180.1 hypothetical protein [Corynebacterium pygosceleis]MCX7445083.1 hypothetical protein [Corynebacterium pygosceleis]MCX7469405.1 hypothetical protein [Corynebacterium pygosceleis]
MKNPIHRIAAAGGAAALAALTSLPTAGAVPPGGPGPDTPGTSSSVSPGAVAPCETVTYSVEGFPAGETLNIKLDDGSGYSDQSVHGTGVIATQRISSDGSAYGSVLLPCDIDDGEHWLRFLSSRELTDSDGNYLGIEGYTSHSTYFTVVSGGGDTGGTGGGDTGTGGGGGNFLDTFLKEDSGTNKANDDNGGDGTQSGTGDRSGGGSPAADRGGTAGGGPRTVTTVIDEPAPGGGSGQGARREENHANGRPADSGKAGKSIERSTLAARAGAAQSGGTRPSSAVTDTDGAAESGSDDIQPASVAAESNRAPMVGLLVGGAILIVGLAGVAAYLYTHRTRPDANR